MPDTLPLLAVPGCVVRALQLMIAAPLPGRGQAARQLRLRPLLPKLDPEQREPAAGGIAQEPDNALLTAQPLLCRFLEPFDLRRDPRIALPCPASQTRATAGRSRAAAAESR